jgi:beta-galactosidase
VNEDRDERPAGAEPRPSVQRTANVPTLKPWILPTGNAFIKDPAKRHQRPAGNPGGDVPYVREDFDDRSWRHVDLPHDWGIEGPFLETGPHGGMGRLPSWGVGWYRKTLHIAPGGAGRSIFLDVDGAMSYATVWLNGQIAGGWPYGYSSWRVDLTPYIRHGGANLLAIRVDNPPGSSRWYPGGGIYRNVWLTRTHALHVSRWGTFVRTRNVSSSSATIDLDVTIDNDSPRSETVDVATDIYAVDAGGASAGDAVASIAPVEVTIAARSNATLAGSVTMADPRLWGPPPNQRPNRYVAVTTVLHRGRTVDRYETRFGIRDLRIDPDRGIFVNGRAGRHQRRQSAPRPWRARRGIQHARGRAAARDPA